MIKFALHFLIAAIFIPMASFAEDAQADARPAYAKRADNLYKDLKNVKRDLVYKVADGENLSMDLIMPETPLYRDGSPVVIYIHGGGWGGGERYVLHPNVLKRYTDKGIAVACISYRLVKPGRTVLECIEDCKDAARFLAKNAKKYGLDPKRFAARGHSAGGHLSLMEALAPMKDFPGDPALKNQNPAFVCVAAYAPVTSFADPEASEPRALTSNIKDMTRLLGGNPEEKQDLAKKISPLEYLKKNSPAIFLVHGGDDPLVSVNGSRLLEKNAKKLGVEIVYKELENGDHSFNTHGKETNYTPQELDEAGYEFLFGHLLKGVKKK